MLGRTTDFESIHDLHGLRIYDSHIIGSQVGDIDTLQVIDHSRTQLTNCCFAVEIIGINNRRHSCNGGNSDFGA